VAPASQSNPGDIMAELKQFDVLIPVQCSNNLPEAAKPDTPEKRVFCTTGSLFIFPA
jgi:hypothetical protein